MKRGHGELFRVDRRTGQITLKQTLDAHNQLYSLVIAAFDGGESIEEKETLESFNSTHYRVAL